MVPLEYTSAITCWVMVWAVPFIEITPPETDQTLPAPSTSWLTAGIMLPLAEAVGLLETVGVLMMVPTPTPLLPLKLVWLVVAPQPGRPAAVGWPVDTQAPLIHFHHMQWLFSWKMTPLKYSSTITC
jgi:hypothetical protein